MCVCVCVGGRACCNLNAFLVLGTRSCGEAEVGTWLAGVSRDCFKFGQIKKPLRKPDSHREDQDSQRGFRGGEGKEKKKSKEVLRRAKRREKENTQVVRHLEKILPAH